MLKLVFAGAVCNVWTKEISENCLFSRQFLPSVSSLKCRLKCSTGRKGFSVFSSGVPHQVVLYLDIMELLQHIENGRANVF